jgi:hypothetical protein
MRVSSVVIDDLYTVSVSLLPDKANAKLVIDPDTVQAVAVPLQGFQAVTGRPIQVLERGCGIQHPKFSQGRLLNHRRDFFDRLQIKQPLGLFALEGPDHPLKLSW